MVDLAGLILNSFFHKSIRMTLFLLALAFIISSCSAVDICVGPLVQITISSTHDQHILAAQSLLGKELNTSITSFIHAASPIDACSPLERTSAMSGSVLLVKRGNCSFLDKAINVNASEATAMLLMDDVDGCINMGADENATSLISSLRIYSLSISQRSGQDLLSLLSEPSDNLISIVLKPIDTTRMDHSIFLLLLIAVGSVVIGALWSGHDYLNERRETGSKKGEKEARDEGIQTQELTTVHAFAFILLASGSLILLYFFLNSVFFYILLVLISLSFIQSSTVLLSALARITSPRLNSKSIMLPLLGEKVLLSELSALPVAVIAVIWWAVERNERYSWIMQDAFGISLMLLILRVLRVQSLKVSTILLSLAFCYDVFFVFISPLFFGSSVMVTVAKGGSSGESLPMLLKFPRFGLPYEFASFSMLGYGDVILPGLLVGFLRRFQVHNPDKTNRISYFLLCSISYAIGLCLTMAALYFSWFGDQGQPALLYLVPCTIGSTTALSWWRGELMILWNGIDDDVDAQEDGVQEDEEQPLISSQV